MTGLDVEAVLRDHAFSLSTNKCLCGLGPRRGQNWFAHRAHVAAVLRVEIAAWLRGDDALYAAAYRESDDLMGVLSALADQLDPYRASLAADEGDRQ